MYNNDTPFREGHVYFTITKLIEAAAVEGLIASRRQRIAWQKQRTVL